MVEDYNTGGAHLGPRVWNSAHQISICARSDHQHTRTLKYGLLIPTIELLGLNFTILFFRKEKSNHYTANYTNKFWGFNERDAQQKLHPVLSLVGKMTQFLHQNILRELIGVKNHLDYFGRHVSICLLTVSSRPCLETNPHSTLRTPFAGHCLGALWGGKPCPAELSDGVNRVLRTLSGDPRLPIPPTPSAGHCLDTHGVCRTKLPPKHLNRYEKWFEKREKGSEKWSETRLDIF